MYVIPASIRRSCMEVLQTSLKLYNIKLRKMFD